MFLQVLSTDAYDGYAADVWSCGVVLFTMLQVSFVCHGAQQLTTSQLRYIAACNRGIELLLRLQAACWCS